MANQLFCFIFSPRKCVAKIHDLSYVVWQRLILLCAFYWLILLLTYFILLGWGDGDESPFPGPGEGQHWPGGAEGEHHLGAAKSARQTSGKTLIIL